MIISKKQGKRKDGKRTCKGSQQEIWTQKRLFPYADRRSCGNHIDFIVFVCAGRPRGGLEALTTDDVQADVAMLVVAGTNQVLFEKVRTKLSSRQASQRL